MPHNAQLVRGVAQPGSALAWGARGREFESRRPDHEIPGKRRCTDSVCLLFLRQFTLPEEGVKEIRNASHSFNLMREQVLGNLEERNRMISAMTHDLRTPLTKLQLRLERVQPQELREKLQATTAEMSSIIVQGLEFARSLTTNEKPIRLELVSFLQSLVDDATDVGGKVALQCEVTGEEKTVVVSARTWCLHRCLENLISNANKYAGEAKVVLQKSPRASSFRFWTTDRAFLKKNLKLYLSRTIDLNLPETVRRVERVWDCALLETWQRSMAQNLR